MRGTLLSAAALSVVGVDGGTPTPTMMRDKEVGLQFGMYDETHPPECDFPELNMQFNSEECVFIDKDWPVWKQANYFIPPANLFIKFACSQGYAHYKVYVDCLNAPAKVQEVCAFAGMPHCGRTAVDASQYLEFSTNIIDGVCNPQCITLPESMDPELVGRQCMNMRVNHCVDTTPAPAITPPPAPVWPALSQGLFSARMRLAVEDGAGCPSSQTFTTPPFHNGDCIDLVKASGQELPSAVADMGVTLAFKIKCHPSIKAIEYSTYTSADCGTVSSSKLPSGWANFGDCVHQEFVVTPADVPSAPDMGVAWRLPMYFEVDDCTFSTPVPPFSPTIVPLPSPKPPPPPTPGTPPTSKPGGKPTGPSVVDPALTPEQDNSGSTAMMTVGLIALIAALALVGYNYRLRKMTWHQQLARSAELEDRAFANESMRSLTEEPSPHSIASREELVGGDVTN